MRLAKLFEGLDDKDEFRSDPRSCGMCVIQRRDIDDTEGFHEAHVAADRIANRTWASLPDDTTDEAYNQIYSDEMRKRGWVAEPGALDDIRLNLYRKISQDVREGLDDKDEFMSRCLTCLSHCGENPIPAGFHQAHVEADGIVSHLVGLGISNGSVTINNWEDVYYKQFCSEMSKRGYDWDMSHIKEDLDDKDEFMTAPCWACRIHGRLDDSEGFHEAHLAASRAAGARMPDNHYETEMYRLGWVRFKGTWYKKDDPRIRERMTLRADPRTKMRDLES